MKTNLTIMRSGLRSGLRAGLLAGATLAAASNAWAQTPAPASPPPDIVGAQVKEKTPGDSTAERLARALGETGRNVEQVMKLWHVDELDVVYLDQSQGTNPLPEEIAAKIDETQVERLQAAVTGNAMLYHAVQELPVEVNDIIAIEFEKAGKIVLYAQRNVPK